MDISSLVFDNDLAGLIITLAAQSIFISLFGIAIIKLLRKRSAPVRSLVCTCVIGILGLGIILSAGFRLSGISWSGVTLPVHSIEGAWPKFKNTDFPDTPVNSSSIQPAGQYRSDGETDLKLVPTGKGPDIVPVSTSLADKTGYIEPSHSMLITPPFIFLINLFGFIWFMGLLFHIIRLGYGLVQVNHFQKNLKPVSDMFYTKMARSASGVFWNNRAPSLYRSSDIESPVTIGLFKPLIIIPDKLFGALTQDELKSILLHELSHIYHHDQFMDVIKRIILALHWWNPIVHRINRIHEQTREEVSDNYVLSELHPETYTKCLANLVEKVCLVSNVPAASCMAGKNFSLLTRVEQILSAKRSVVMNTKLYLKAAIFSIGLLLTFGAAGLQGKVESKTYADDPKTLSTTDRRTFSVEVQQPSPAAITEQAESSTGSNSNETERLGIPSQDKQEIKIKKSGAVSITFKNENNITKKQAEFETGQKTKKTVSNSDIKVNDAPVIIGEYIEIFHNEASTQRPSENKTYSMQKETLRLAANIKKKKSAEYEDVRPKEPEQKEHKELFDTAEQNHYTADDYLSLGKTCLRNGETEKAVSYFSRAIELNKKNAELYLLRGNAYAVKNNHEKAIDEYSKAIELNPEYFYALNNRGYLFFIIQEYDKAIKDFKMAVEIKPDYSHAYYNRGNAYTAKGKFRKAISDYSKAIKINPEFFSAYLNRGKVHHQNRNKSKAITDYTKALELKETAYVYLLRGNVYREKRKYRDAVNDYSRAIELSPDLPVAYLIRGQVYDKTDYHEKAIIDYSKAIEIDSENYYNYLIRGNAYYREKDYDKAISDLSKVIELKPDFGMAYNMRSEVYRLTDQNIKAENDSKMAAKLAPPAPAFAPKFRGDNWPKTRAEVAYHAMQNSDIEDRRRNFEDTMRHFIGLPPESIFGIQFDY